MPASRIGKDAVKDPKECESHTRGRHWQRMQNQGLGEAIPLVAWLKTPANGAGMGLLKPERRSWNRWKRANVPAGVPGGLT